MTKAEGQTPTSRTQAMQQIQGMADVLRKERTADIYDLFAVTILVHPTIDFPRLEAIVNLLVSSGLAERVDNLVTWIGPER
jgi:hypothetical protein